MATRDWSPKGDRPRPRVYDGMDDKPFWEYCKKHEYRMQKCSDCGEWRYPAAMICDHCLSDKFTWEPLSGKGKILTWIIQHRTYFPGIPAPYNCILVELDEGPLVISNLVGVPNEAIKFDMPVKVDFLDLPEEGFTLPIFHPA